MTDRLQPNRKVRKAVPDAVADKTATNAGLSHEDEERLRREFEHLIERMKAPESAAAYDALARMTGEEVRGFLQAAEHFLDDQAPTDRPAINLDFFTRTTHE